MRPLVFFLVGLLIPALSVTADTLPSSSIRSISRAAATDAAPQRQQGKPGHFGFDGGNPDRRFVPPDHRLRIRPLNQRELLALRMRDLGEEPFRHRLAIHRQPRPGFFQFDDAPLPRIHVDPPPAPGPIVQPPILHPDPWNVPMALTFEEAEPPPDLADDEPDPR